MNSAGVTGARGQHAAWNAAVANSFGRDTARRITVMVTEKWLELVTHIRVKVSNCLSNL